MKLKKHKQKHNKVKETQTNLTENAKNDTIPKNVREEKELLKMTEYDEFLAVKKERKPGYTTSTREDGTNVVIVDQKRMTKAEKFNVEMLVKSGYEIKSKKKDITRNDMIRYVKKNYDEAELKVLEAELNKINTETTDKTKITFMTVKNWFKERYIFYPKGIDYKYKDQEKQERYIKAFNKHKNELRPGNRPQQQPGEEHNNNNNNNENKK